MEAEEDGWELDGGVIIRPIVLNLGSNNGLDVSCRARLNGQSCLWIVLRHNDTEKGVTSRSPVIVFQKKETQQKVVSMMGSVTKSKFEYFKRRDITSPHFETKETKDETED